MTRQQALENIRVAAFEGDMHTAVRIYVENRVSRAAFQEALDRGTSQKKLHTHSYTDINGTLVCRFCGHKWSL